MIRLLFLIAMVITLLASTAATWTGTCVRVIDGDTITATHLDKIETIRLYGIDCPEKKQPLFESAKRFTSARVLGRSITVEATGIGKYGRTIAWVRVDDQCLSRGLLKAGLARHFKYYSKDKDLALLETEAKRKRIGIWETRREQ